MKKVLSIILFLIFIILFNGCRNGSPTNNPIVISSDNIFFVDINIGSNSNDGKKDNPFKTISYALSKASKKQTIYVEGGIYSEDNGEQFPLKLFSNKIFYSSKNDKSVIIQGSGEFEGYKVAIVLDGNSTLQGVTINSNNNIGILSKDGNNHIVSSVLSNNEIALSIHNNSKIDLINSEIINNSLRGIELIDSSSLELLSSTIENNYIGINIANQAKLLSTSQNSKIINNEQCDFFTKSNSNMILEGIVWDESVLDFNIEKQCLNGHNIVRADSVAKSTIIYQNIMVPLKDSSSLDLNTLSHGEDDLIFNNTKTIDVIHPSNNQQIETTQPYIKYMHTINNKYLMITIWKKKPNVKDSLVQNPEDIVWYWHTGMNNSEIGYVEYNQGSTPINGKIDTGIHKNNSLEELVSGRTYYLVIWEWDTKGKNIIASSIYSIFHVR